MNEILKYKRDYSKVSETTQNLITMQLRLVNSKDETIRIVNAYMKHEFLTNHLSLNELKGFIMLNCDDEMTLNLLKIKTYRLNGVNNDK